MVRTVTIWNRWLELSPLAIRLGRTWSVPKVLRKRQTVGWYTTPIRYIIPPCAGNIITLLQSCDTFSYPPPPLIWSTAPQLIYTPPRVIYFFPFFCVIMQTAPSQQQQQTNYTQSAFTVEYNTQSAFTVGYNTQSAFTMGYNTQSAFTMEHNTQSAFTTNSKHWFTTSFLQPLPYLVTP